MKIVNLILTSQNGGAEQVFIDYMVVLKNLGHEVLAVVKDDAPYADKISTLGIKVKKIRNRFGYHDFFAIKELQKLLLEFDADATISHMGRAVVLMRKAVKKIKNKVIVQIAVNHSMNVKRSIGADYIFSVNREILYRTYQLGQSETKTFVIPNAVDLSDAINEFAPVNLQTKEKIILGVMARLDQGKGFQYAIKALKNLPDKKFILKIAGTGPYQPQLETLVRDLNLQSQVEFCGWIEDKKRFFQEIDIFCLTSEAETFGLVLLEAIKYRKPIIATDIEGPREVLRNEIDGLLIALKPQNTLDQRLANAVMQLVNNPELIEKFLTNSFARLQLRFSYHALTDVLREMVGIMKRNIKK